MQLFAVIYVGCVLLAVECGKVIFFEQENKEDTPPKTDVLVGGNSLTCPDGSTCFGTAACCRTFTGHYSCCAWPNDVCCDGGQHCCPRLTICDPRSFTCSPGSNSPPWTRAVSSLPAAQVPEIAITESLVGKEETQDEVPNDLICPNGSKCAGIAACCRTYTGTFSCCGYPNDVCCSDGLLCCPRGTICDVRNHQCLPGDGAKPVPAIPTI